MEMTEVVDKKVTLRPEEIRFKKKYMEIRDSQYGICRIPYKEMVLAYINVRDEESDRCYRPDITEITKNMGRDLILYDSQHCCFNIQMDLTEKTAGAVLGELTRHAPYILAGGQEWFDEEDKEQFFRIGEMVEIMRGCV